MDLLRRLPRELLEEVVPYLATPEMELFGDWQQRFIDWLLLNRTVRARAIDQSSPHLLARGDDRLIWELDNTLMLTLFTRIQPTRMSFTIYEQFSEGKLVCIMRYVRAIPK